MDSEQRRVTRSVAAKSTTGQPTESGFASGRRIFLESPQSPSTVAAPPASRTATRAEGPAAGTPMPGPSTEMAPPSSRVHSVASRRTVRSGSRRSTASVLARVKQAEYEAAEEIARLKEQVVKKRLEARVAAITAEDGGSEEEIEEIEVEQEPVNTARVQEWVKNSRDATRNAPPEEQWRDRDVTEASRIVADETPPQGEQRRDTARNVRTPGRRTQFASPPPQNRHEQRENRETSTERNPEGGSRFARGIQELADSIGKLSCQRTRPRQTAELQAYNGDATEWLPFKAMYVQSTQMYKYTAVENLARLRASLQGEARKAVLSLLHTATNPDVIMKRLEQTFGRPELLIAHVFADIKALPRAGTTGSDVNRFSIAVQNIVSTLEAIDNKGYMANPLLVEEILRKLEPHTETEWCKYAAQAELSGDTSPELVKLSKFLEEYANRTIRYTHSMMSSIATTSAAATERRRGPQPLARKTRSAAVHTATEEKKSPCLCCGGEHAVVQCTRLREMSTDERWQWVKENNVCFKCISKRHRRYNCRAKPCGVNECKAGHHRLLHNERTTPPAPQPEAEPVPSTSAAVMTCNINAQKVLLKVCPVELSGPTGAVKVFALLDEGSTVTLVAANIARRIGASGLRQPLNLHGVNTSSTDKTSERIKLYIAGANGKKHEVTARTISDLKLQPQSVPKEVLQHAHMKHLSQDAVTYDAATPEILVGADNWDLIVSREVRAGQRRGPVASRTRLGWVVHGYAPRTLPAYDSDDSDAETVTHARLEDLVEEYIQLEGQLTCTAAPRVNADDQRAVQVFENTVQRLDNGQFEVGLTWRDDNITLPPSYAAALRRLKAVERKMDQSADFRAQYTVQIENLFKKGYAVPCDSSDESHHRAWYLPHFAVRNINKPGKVRIVFDAAAKVGGTSLNDALLEGPDLLKPLIGILFRFREHSVALSADIEEMFLRVRIRREDQPAQMFLWRGDNRDEPPCKYKMASMIFGAACSPFLAHSVRDRNAHQHETEYPAAARAITNSHYMDDYIDSIATPGEAVQLARDVAYVHRQAGFNLRGWHSNDAAVQEAIAPEERGASEVRLGTKPGHHERTLGLLWSASTDELAFDTTMPRVADDVRHRLRVPTKREVLSAVMSVYDPLGLIAPFVISGKLVLQRLWQYDIGWDDAIPEEEADDFDAWQEGLEQVKNLRLSRCYRSSGAPPADAAQLHIFCDASAQAYAAAAYWRFEYDGKVEVTLAAAKVKVAPRKPMSIPRLELQAAVLGSRLAEAVRSEHRLQATSTTYWTDSRTVSQWIKTDARRYVPFVAHRLGEIDELTRKANWRWLPTDENVADEATRAQYDLRLAAGDRWFRGPRFLYKPPSAWPSPPTADDSCTSETVLAAQEEPANEYAELPDMSRFSSYTRLVRATAYVKLFVEKLRGRREGPLQVSDLDDARDRWLQRSQRESFAKDLRKGKPLKSGRLWKLDPVTGEDGLLRLGGRVAAADGVSQAAKRPIILDGRHPFVRLLVHHEHVAAGHANNERVINDLRQRYWVLRLRPTVRAIAHSCQLCRVQRAAPKTPPTGDLPSERFAHHQRAFTSCAVDYFGPMLVAIGRRREKRYGALFTCLTTRAVHLELVASLTTDSAIMAIRRMAARRGWPRKMYSDNATNFRGADKELRAAYLQWLPRLGEYATTRGMVWKYIPPGAPHMGGAWERLVRSIKTALRAVLHQRAPREEVLHTLLLEAENSVNGRPLTHVPVDPADPEALTPNHFLIGSSTGLPLLGKYERCNIGSWKASQFLADLFWRRWLREYLPTLVPRGQPAARAQELQPGDLVVVVDPQSPRNMWPRGVITRVLPGRDGCVRMADVRTKNGVLRRPATKLAVLPVQ